MESAATHPVKRILILGANGQLGSLLHEYLSVQMQDTEVIGCIRRTYTTSGNYLLFDPFTDNWQKLGKADVLINCIGIIRETAQTTFEKAHESITGYILKNRYLIGDPRIIQISALGADENSRISFLQTKGKADQKLLKHPDTIVVRPSIVCTPDTMLAQKLKQLVAISNALFHHLPFPVHLLKTRIQPIMPVDLAAIVVQLCCLKNPPALVHAVGPSPLSLAQLLRLSSPHFIKFISLPKKLSDAAAKITGSLLPDLLTQEQYQLLQQDNTYPVHEVEMLLNRKLHSTEQFWRAASR